jgi:hypothetical protein
MGGFRNRGKVIRNRGIRYLGYLKFRNRGKVICNRGSRYLGY